MRPRLSRVPEASLALRGIPPVDWTTHKVEAQAGGLAGGEFLVGIESVSGSAPVTLSLEGVGVTSVDPTPVSAYQGATFRCQSADTIRALAGALLGALAEAERRGVIAAAAPEVLEALP